MLNYSCPFRTTSFDFVSWLADLTYSITGGFFFYLQQKLFRLPRHIRRFFGTPKTAALIIKAAASEKRVICPPNAGCSVFWGTHHVDRLPHDGFFFCRRAAEQINSSFRLERSSNLPQDYRGGSQQASVVTRYSGKPPQMCGVSDVPATFSVAPRPMRSL